MLNYAELRKFLAQDKLAKLVEALHAATARLDTDLNNQVVTIAGRLTRVSTQLNTGQISHVEANQERSRISAALLDIINQLEANYPAAAQQQAGYQQQQRVRQIAPPRQQGRPVWPYVLLGVVGCIIVLAVIGNMMNSDGTTSLEPTSTSFQEPTNSNTGTPITPTKSGGSTTKFTDERPAEPPAATNSTGYTAADLVGTWQTSFSDGTYQMAAHARFNGDGSCYLEVYLNQVLLNSEAGTWQVSGNTLYQNLPNGGPSSSSIRWVNRNQFQATSADEGITLTYFRMN